MFQGFGAPAILTSQKTVAVMLLLTVCQHSIALNTLSLTDQYHDSTGGEEMGAHTWRNTRRGQGRAASTEEGGTPPVLPKFVPLTPRLPTLQYVT